MFLMKIEKIAKTIHNKVHQFFYKMAKCFQSAENSDKLGEQRHTFDPVTVNLFEKIT
jgi:hypothetical protein